jgi:tetratricopeptide (TPR) repeat protein
VGSHIRNLAVLDSSAIHVGHIVLLIYAMFAVSVVVRLVRSGKRTFDDAFTDSDRALVGTAAFYLGLPTVLIAHELVQLSVLGAFGADRADVVRWIEDATLPTGSHALTPIQVVLFAISGNAVALAIGVGSIVLTLLRPGSAARNFAQLELGRIVLAVTVVIHPAISLLLGHGSAHVLRTTLNGQLPHLGNAAVLVMAAITFATIRGVGRRRFARWYVELATPLFHAIRTARSRAQADPENADHQRDLAGALLAAGRFDLADAPLTRAVSLDPDDARTQFLVGMLRLKQDRPDAAATALCAAGQLVEAGPSTSVADRRGLELEIVIALATARLRLNDADGAIATAEAALQIARRDARALVVYSDALVLAGRKDEAGAPLSLALEDAHGSVEGEIRRRLEALSRGR